MAQRKFSAQPECRSRAGPITARRLICTAAAMAAALGLTACVGPYDDGYSHTRIQYQSSPTYHHDNGYEQRRRSAYPNGSPDRPRWGVSWWHGTTYSGDRYNYDR